MGSSLQNLENKGVVENYKSSAGSGKTYTLSKQYLRLALDKPKYAYRHIVALTFTNKATKEMRDRVLSLLHGLREQSNEQLAWQLAKELGVSSEEVYKRAETTLLYMLHDYSHVEVSTLDAFMQRLFVVFRLEENLPDGLGLVIDTKEALNEVVKGLYEQMGQDEVLAQWLHDFSTYLLAKGSSWRFEKQVVEFAGDLFKDRYLMLCKEKKHVSLKDALASLQTRFQAVKDKINHLENKLKAWYVQANQCLKEYNLEPEDLKFAKQGPWSVFEAISRKNYFLVPGKRAIEACEAGSAEAISYWATQKSPHGHAIERCLAGGLFDVHKEIVQFLGSEKGAKKGRYYRSLEGYVKRHYYLGLIPYLEQGLAEYRSQQGAYFLSDVQAIIRRLLKENPLPYVYERVGVHFHHYLLDEFQDTSGLQFETLSPLLKEGLDQGRAQLVVGDSKQSIFRWRDASPMKLYKGFESSFSGRTKTQNLDKNWRSLPAVVSFNNAFFRAAVSYLGNEMANSALEDAYEQVEQKAQKKAPSGFVSCDVLPTEGATKKEVRRKNSRDWLKEKVAWLLKEKGYKPKDICVLVRKNKEARDVSSYLAEYDISSDKSFLVNSALGVQLLARVLELLLYPRNERSSKKGHSFEERWLVLQIQALYYGLEGVPFTEEMRAQSQENPQGTKVGKVLAAIDSKRKNLLALSAYQICARLIDDFGLKKYPEEHPYVEAFLSLALSYEGRPLHQFLSYWQHASSTETLPAKPPKNAIQVHTIHKAKGLEFPVVLIPFCDWELDSASRPGRPNTRLWCDPPKQGVLKSADYLVLDYTKGLEDTQHADIFYEERMASYMDALNLLYVAFTRAKEGLCFCATPQAPPKDESTKEMSGLLKQVFCTEWKAFEQSLDKNYDVKREYDLEHKDDPECKDDSEREEENRSLYWTYGEIEEREEQQPIKEKDTPDDTSCADFFPTWQDCAWNQRLLIDSTKELKGLDTIDLKAEASFHREAELARIRGLRMHALLASLDRVDALDALTKALEKEYEGSWYTSRLRLLFEHKQIKDWYGERYVLRHEQNIEDTKEAESAKGARPKRADLLAYRYDETGELKELHVIDFKPGNTSSEEEGQEKYQKEHHKQVRGYMELVAESYPMLQLYDTLKGFVVYYTPVADVCEISSSS